MMPSSTSLNTPAEPGERPFIPASLQAGPIVPDAEGGILPTPQPAPHPSNPLREHRSGAGRLAIRTTYSACFGAEAATVAAVTPP